VAEFGAGLSGERIGAPRLAGVDTGGEKSPAGAAPLSRVPDGRGPMSAGGREEAVGRARVLSRALGRECAGLNRVRGQAVKPGRPS
jgi:hypothetical protein